MSQGGERHWSRRAELGAGWGLELVFQAHRWLGRWPFRLALVPVVLYYFLLSPERRRASRQYLEALHKSGGLAAKPGAGMVFAHFWSFAETTLDKVLAWDPGWPAPQVSFHGQAAVSAHLSQGRGVMLIGSHLGNLEMARALVRGGERVTVNVLVHTRHAARFNALMARVNPQSQARLFQVDSLGPETVVLLKQKLDAGEVLLITGDRTPPHGRHATRAHFLGHDAAWPVGPYVLAAALQCPVLLFFCLERPGGYEVHYEPFAERLELPREARAEALQACAARFASRLARHCAAAPLQWHNFYPFWDLPVEQTR
jgi:predicted LPLAT superfamily acyltransferase